MWVTDRGRHLFSNGGHWKSLSRGTLYNVSLFPDVVKVTVKKVQVADAHVPLPRDEVTIVVETFQTFIVWPRHLVWIKLEPPVIISLY